MKKLERVFKKSMMFAIAFVFALAGMFLTASRVKAASSTNRLPIYAYTLEGRVPTYSTLTSNSSDGYIDGWDLTKIIAFYPDNGRIKVQYPAPVKPRTAYAKMSDFFADVSFNTSTGRTGRQLTAYRNATGSATIGTVFSSDQCIRTGARNGRTQVIYPAGSSGYKLGWVSGTYNFAPANTGLVLSDSQGTAICFDAEYYANSYSDLKRAFGYDYNSLLNHWKNYGIKEGRSASPVFDPQYYLKENKDLAKAFGNNYMSAYSHFKSNGCGEGRKSSKYYDGSYYRNKYGDLSKMSYYDLAIHYLGWGIKEKRTANSSGYIPSGMDRIDSGNGGSKGFDPIWPCEKTYVVSTLYKYSSGAKHSTRFKYGIDIAAPRGENVLAVEAGKVILSEYSTTSGFGNWIMIQHDNGKVSLYAHLTTRYVSKIKGFQRDRLLER